MGGGGEAGQVRPDRRGDRQRGLDADGGDRGKVHAEHGTQRQLPAALRAQRRGFRVVHYSIQDDHAHFLVEAQGKVCLANGMKGLAARFARVGRVPAGALVLPLMAVRGCAHARTVGFVPGRDKPVPYGFCGRAKHSRVVSRPRRSVQPQRPQSPST